jgi:malate dehydrogenase (oxaloacetate-decarboxylating)
VSKLNEEALKLHKDNQGKLGVYSKVPLRNSQDLTLAYSPGVAEPCMAIFEDENKIYDYTIKGNLVAVVTNGTAVLGLGNIGPRAALPVMEGKALLFKAFAGIDAFPLCLDTSDTEAFIETVKLLEPTFGGINLEDIAAPQCFEIEERLKKECNIPVFHDDQHGTAIVTSAGLINSLRVVGKTIDQIRVVVNGAGAAGIAIIKMLIHLGVHDVILCDTKGIIYEGRLEGMNGIKEEVARITNKEGKKGTIIDAMIGADVFIGVSAAGAINREMITSMNRDPIVFALANPVPEIMPEEAASAGAKVIATGRSDLPNQVNNVLAFPGIFRGALDVRAREINEDMKLAAVYAIADLIPVSELRADYVIPHPFDPRVVSHVAVAVAQAAMSTGVAQIRVDLETLRKRYIEEKNARP